MKLTKDVKAEFAVIWESHQQDFSPKLTRVVH